MHAAGAGLVRTDGRVTAEVPSASESAVLARRAVDARREGRGQGGVDGGESYVCVLTLSSARAVTSPRVAGKRYPSDS